ncbi:MAG: hypothetical protein ABJB05_03195 [Parafilimonas sp.]
MESKSKNTADLQKTLTDNFQQLTNLSLSALKPMMEGMINNMSSISNSILKNGLPTIQIPKIGESNCDCPPEETCPPHCIAAITRYAMQGERIITSFTVQNDCNQTKTWRIGVRDLKDENGALAPAQPILNKNFVTLDAGRSEQVLVSLDLGNFNNGSTYTTEIVLREKEINQNICFTLIVDNSGSTLVTPLDEQQYLLRWQSWKDHYYCERPTFSRVPGTNVLSIAGK